MEIEESNQRMVRVEAPCIVRERGCVCVVLKYK